MDFPDFGVYEGGTWFGPAWRATPAPVRSALSAAAAAAGRGVLDYVRYLGRDGADAVASRLLSRPRLLRQVQARARWRRRYRFTQPLRYQRRFGLTVGQKRDRARRIERLGGRVRGSRYWDWVRGYLPDWYYRRDTFQLHGHYISI